MHTSLSTAATTVQHKSPARTQSMNMMLLTESLTAMDIETGKRQKHLIR